MAYFKSKVMYEPIPIPSTPPYNPPAIPSVEEGSEPYIARPSFVGDSDMALFVNSSDKNRAYKNLTKRIEFDGAFKENVDMIRPLITIESSIDLTEYNYIYIKQFKRFYNCSIRLLVGQLYQIDCVVDALCSFLEELLYIPCIIDKEEVHNDLYINDGTYVQGNKNYTKVYNFSNGFNDTPNNVLICCGGKDVS